MSRTRRPGVFGGTAWSIGQVAGIDLAIDKSWLLIFALITFSLGTRFAASELDWGPVQVASGAVFASVLFFASLVLHELGHSLVALRLGVGVRSITLFLFGGVAQLESEPQRPRDEILIATAGPLVSIGLGFAFLFVASLMPETQGTAELLRTALVWLGGINLVLAIFNFLPGFPLDGGRVLRGIVWSATGSFRRATQAAAASGSLLAYGLMVLGAVSALTTGQVLGGLWLVFIGWFLLTAARASVAQLALEGVLGGLRADEVMETVSERCLSGSETVASVAEAAILKRGFRTFYVIDRSQHLQGLVTLAEIAATAPEQRPITAIAEVMRPVNTLEILTVGESAWDALRKMAENNVSQLPVIEAGRLLGAVTREGLMSVVQAGVALRAA